MRLSARVSLFVLLGIWLLTGLSAHQGVRAQAPTAFPDSSFMQLGVYYYPEAWPREQWTRDLNKIRELGFTFTHYGEFAWALMEPSEGRFTFGWLDTAIDLASKAGLKVILCTPSPTPPAWLTHAHPEVLMVRADGRLMQHGARQHASWSSVVYRRYVRRITEQLGRRYGQHPAVWGWQLDNEPSHYGNEYDYSPAAQASFRVWLQRRYGTLNTLNKVWGTTFWSQIYTDWAQIRIPNRTEMVQSPNPHALLDFRRFQADEIAGFLREQQQVLRDHVAPRQWITTNHMTNYLATNPRKNPELDIVTYTMYPAAGFSGQADTIFRTGSALTIAKASDAFRPITGQTAIMELQPGQVNWGRYNPQPAPGAVRLWLMSALSSGCRFVCSYRFRQPLSGYELYHYGMMEPDGVTVSPGGQEFSTFSRELMELKAASRPGRMAPAGGLPRVALLTNNDNAYDLSNLAQTYQWSTWAHMDKYYAAAKRQSAKVDIIDGREALGGQPGHRGIGDYGVAIAPAYQLVDADLVARWRAYVEQGGHLILTCRTGQKDTAGHLWEGPRSAPVADLAGIRLRMFDMLPDNAPASVLYDKQTHLYSSWADVLDPAEGVETWASYGAPAFYSGSSAISHRRLGRGTVTYVGVDTRDGALEAAVVERVLKLAYSSAPPRLPDNVVAEYRDGLWYVLNYRNSPYRLLLPQGAKVIMGKNPVPTRDVLVYRAD